MEIVNNESNEITLNVVAGETCFFASDFLRTASFTGSVLWKKDHGFLRALVSRFLSGRLYDLFLTPTHESQVLKLSGSESHGHFLVQTLNSGQRSVVRLPYLKAYQFQENGKFQVKSCLFDPVRWITGTVFVVIVEGPATLIFYGSGLQDSTVTECFADQVVAFDAGVPFEVTGFGPKGLGWFAQVFNAFSSTVNMRFASSTHLVLNTFRTEAHSRLRQVPNYLFLGVLVGGLLEWLLMGK